MAQSLNPTKIEKLCIGDVFQMFKAGSIEYVVLDRIPCRRFGRDAIKIVTRNDQGRLRDFYDGLTVYVVNTADSSNLA